MDVIRDRPDLADGVEKEEGFGAIGHRDGHDVFFLHPEGHELAAGCVDFPV